MSGHKFLRTIADPNTCITPIDTAIRFPEILEELYEKYEGDITLFCRLISNSATSGELLDKIRSPSIESDTRMSLLKMFRRCVAPVLDTETTKKISKVSTKSLVDNFGHTFKPIGVLKEQFSKLPKESRAALAALIGEYDTRGQSGYRLTGIFFPLFGEMFPDLFIEGPIGAGKDIELSSLFPEFKGNYPCDFVIRQKSNKKVLAVGFARYDSTRGGAQSDDRTGGNSLKVTKAKEFCDRTGKQFRLIFLSEGPGLNHKDTWEEACELDGSWDGNVRVTTLKLAKLRLTRDWLVGKLSN
jgi:hypothetical protein